MRFLTIDNLIGCLDLSNGPARQGLTRIKMLQSRDKNGRRVLPSPLKVWVANSALRKTKRHTLVQKHSRWQPDYGFRMDRSRTRLQNNLANGQVWSFVSEFKTETEKPKWISAFQFSVFLYEI